MSPSKMLRTLREMLHVGRRAPVVLPLVAAGLLACGAARAEVTVVDAGGRSVTVTESSRIASIGGDVTEILYALGLQDRVVAIDTTSLYPPEALKEKKNVGYMRALSTEGVLSTGATVIIASERSGPPDVVKALKAASVPYVEIHDTFDPAGVAAKIRLIAHTAGADAAGEKIAAAVDADFKRLAMARAGIAKPMRVLFVISLQNGRTVVGGKGTSADAILHLAGAENAAGDVNGFKPLADEAILEMAPDAILVMQHSNASYTGELLALKGVEATPAAKAKRVFDVDGSYMLGFGPRAAAAARDLMAKFYPAGSTAAPVR